MARSIGNTGNPIDGVGIDFGTTNSLVATASRTKPYPRTKALLSSDGRPHPSVVWYQVGGELKVGRIAKTNILGFSEAPGNFFVSSIKRALGKGKTLTIFETKYEAKQVAAEIFRHLKNDAEEREGIGISEAVVTVPIDFDGLARRDLRSAANDAGIHIKTFVHEPFAAIVGHCFSEKGNRSLEDREGQRILVFDWGGGTLDITIGQIEGGTISELATAGLTDRSGDHFDELLANFAKTAFMERNGILADHLKLLPSTKDRLRSECEFKKIDLSEQLEAKISLDDFYKQNGRAFYLDEYIKRAKFEELIHFDVEEALARVHLALDSAGLHTSDIDLALLIGGTSRIPKIHKEMHDRFGVKITHVENADSIIAEGAAIIDALNLHPVLAGPICIELSDGKPYEIFRAGEIAKSQACSKQVNLFCTDNRDGQARLIVKEGSGPFKDRLVTKSVLAVPVSSKLPMPYKHERVTAKLVIDEDLILKVSAFGATKPAGAEAEIYDLRFALKSFGEVS